MISASVSYRTGEYQFTLYDDGHPSFSLSATCGSERHRGSFATNRRWTVSTYDEYDGSTLLASAGTLSARGTRFTDRWRNF